MKGAMVKFCRVTGQVSGKSGAGVDYYTNLKKRRTFVFTDKTDLKSTKKILQRK